MKNSRSLPALFARDALVSTLVAAIALGPAALPAFAGPQGFDPRRGGATLEHVEGSNNWLIHAPDGSIIQYSSFNIAAAEAVRFSQTIGGVENADARVLNRILNGLPTHIEGSLTGNGHIYLVNPAGVYFGEGATVNANAIHAAAGNLSDTDFADEVDRFTSVRGPVQNAGEIRARAISLVGETVVNSGEIIAEDGWIVIAAGNDILIGRDDAGGPLLKIEGGAGAIFDAAMTGVRNTGTIEATGTTASTGVVRVGAGDLYGTAIFSDNAIRARELALAAGNRGDIALAGEVNSDKLDVSLRGTTAGAGELRSAVEGTTTTLRADEVKLSVVGSGQQIRVADDVAFRSQGDAAVGPNKVTLEQTATIASSRLTTLDIGAVAPGTTRDLGLRSTGGNVVIDNKAIVADTNLALSGALADIQGTEALHVASLAVTGATDTAGGNVTSAGDIVASNGDITVQGNLQLTTKPNPNDDPTLDTLVSAHGGTLEVAGNITTSAGGPLRIEARNVDLGTVNDDDEIVGGAITSRGDVKIGFTDVGGVEQTQSVKLTTIDTRGSTAQEGGNVEVAATGDVKIGTIVTNGGAGSSTSQPNRDGGSVTVRAGDAATLDIGSVATGGATAADLAAIDLRGGTVVLNSGLNASGGQIQNADGARDRAVTVRATAAGGEIQLGADSISIAGSDVDLDGAIRGADVVPETGPTTERRVELGITASGATNLRSTAHLKSLTVASKGDTVVLGGDIHADTSVKIGFDGSGTVSNGGTLVTVDANRVELSASDSSATDGRTAQIDLGEDIDLDLFAIAATETEALKAATVVLDQDGAIDSADATRLAGAAQGTTDLRLELRTSDAVTLDGAARTAVTGTDLVIASESFAAIGSPTGAASDFNLSSLDLATRDALDVDFGVTADSVRLAGAGDGDGDLTLRSALHADTITLEAGNGPGSGSGSKVVIDAERASLRNTEGTARPDRIDIIQDAAIDSADLADPDVFGGSVEGLAYGLQSHDSTVTLSAGSSDKFAGSALELRGRTGVNLGSEDLTLASLIAETPAGLVVSQQITATATDGKIRLRAGSDGSGDLEIDARLAADKIELVAGSGNGSDQTARIRLDDGARFSGDTGTGRPVSFTFEQDGAIGVEDGNTAVPSLALFGGDIAGMEYTLRSMGAGLRIDDTANVNGTKLTLLGNGATGVDINGSLNVNGLDLTGDATLSGNLTSTDDVTVRGKLTLDAEGEGVARNQSVSAGAGDLIALGAISKTGAGSVSLGGQKVELAAVSTGHTGDSLTISGTDVTTGALDASGAVGSAGGSITVNPTGGPTPGKVVIASITTRGGNGKVSTSAPEDGRTGGEVTVSGSEIEIGNVNSSGGDASAIGRSGEPKNGGNAGAITLTASEVTLGASLDARGGAGSANAPDVVADHKGEAGNVTVHGSILLAADSTAGEVNAIHGHAVVVDGGVSRADSRELAQTALVVTAQESLSFGGDLAADRIDLEVATGNLDLGPRQISANTLRLAATDGNGRTTTSQVVLTGLVLTDEAGTVASVPKSLTIEQDESIGGAGSPLPALGGVERTVALISHDGGITLDGADVATGTKLTLAANGEANATDPAVQVNGNLDVAGLTIGSVSNGVRVDGNAEIDGNLLVGTTGLLDYAARLDVTGDAAIAGGATFAGESDQSDGNQVLRVGPGRTLTLGGALTTKSTAGKLTLDADAIRLTGTGAQTIENQAGQLELGSANGTGIVKGAFDASGNPVPAAAVAGLTLRGSAENGTGPAITVKGTQELDGDPAVDGRDYAIAIADGDLVIDARVIETDSRVPLEAANWSVEGDVLAFGDATLLGSGVLAGGQDDYVISARRAAQTSSTSRGGELLVAGIKSSDGDLTLRAEGDTATEDIPDPSALFIGSDFDVDHDLTLSGTTEALADTTIHAAGDVVLESELRGIGDVTIASDQVLDIRGDVMLDGSAFQASGANGILFTSAAGTQTISAGSLSFGSGDAKPPKGRASILRDGDLKLIATSGNAKFAKGQRLVVAGDLDISAKKTAILGDTAALSIDVSAGQIDVRGGSDVVANRISVSNRPGARGPGSATFATPTGEQISGDIAGAEVFIRQISDDAVQLNQADLAAGNFPTVDGPALFDYATQVPKLPRPASIVRPRADAARLAEAKQARPLWADELLVYLDARSRRAPTAREQGALPPVSAGPNATTPDTAREEANPAVEQAVVPYRALFRPSTEVDPETGIVQGEDRAPEIQAAFAKAVDVATARDGAAPTAAALAAAIESDPNLADARLYRADLAELIAAANRALGADQRARFRELLLARVAPTGISQAEFNALIP